MKLLFNKIEYYGQWFQDDEFPENFTEKVPPNTRYVFDEEIGDWIEKEEPVIEPDIDNIEE
jgi:O-acetylhomoserine/O-acetylserine sulfhydrylase-like pyridoxal-dependent enzyme